MMELQALLQAHGKHHSMDGLPISQELFQTETLKPGLNSQLLHLHGFPHHLPILINQETPLSIHILQDQLDGQLQLKRL
jgi:hypothetical protein